MPSIGIRIVYQGNASLPGHMYTVFKGADGSVQAFGRYPGGVNNDDIGRELPGASNPANVSKDFPISQSAFDKALAAAQQAQAQAAVWRSVAACASSQASALTCIRIDTNICARFALWCKTFLTLRRRNTKYIANYSIETPAK
jgi:hypothetical protein